MTSKIPADFESDREECEPGRDETWMCHWLRQAFNGTRLTVTTVVDELRAELPPSMFYWSGDRSERLAMYRDAALQHATAEYVIALRTGGEVHLSIVFLGVDEPAVVKKDADRISLQVPYGLASVFAMAVIRVLAPYGIWMTTRKDEPVR